MLMRRLKFELKKELYKIEAIIKAIYIIIISYTYKKGDQLAAFMCKQCNT